MDIFDSMKLFEVAEIKTIDRLTIEREPIGSLELMERAAETCTGWIARHFPVSKRVLVVAGPGNNGGDGLAIARQLARLGYTVQVALLDLNTPFSADCLKNLEKLRSIGNISLDIIKDEQALPLIKQGDLIIDGIFGSGLNRPASGLAARAIEHINRHSTCTLSIDLPSGLFGEDNSNNNHECIVKAHYTLSFQFPKLAFFFASNACYTGDWHLLDIGLHPSAMADTPSLISYLEVDELRSFIRPRLRFAHKGTQGHALLIAGSSGMMGAAVLALRACLRSGCGLGSIHVPEGTSFIIHTTCPEALVSIDPSAKYFSAVPDLTKYTAIGIGPGLGCHSETAQAFELLLRACTAPLVLDADALNLLAANRQLLDHLPVNSILTPHPGEFERLFGKSASEFQRWKLQIEMAQKYKVHILLKGAFSCLVDPQGHSWFNSTGNPGMAKGGSGDALTGLITGLLASHHTPLGAALLGMWLHGKAGDLAADLFGMDAQQAGDLIDQLGPAFKVLRETKTD